MSLKKKLGLGVASAALGLSLIGGGTYAYFSDSAEASSTFAAGTLDLSVDPSTVVDLSNLKPGDKMFRGFELKNDGTLPIKRVFLNTDYTVIDAKGDNGSADFGEHIRVNFLLNIDKMDEVVWTTTLKDLKNMDPKAVRNKFESIFGDEWGTRGLVPGSKDMLGVEFEFVDNGKDQNVFQGDSLNLKWTFNAEQTRGQEK
ncbi:spore coat-associated protein N [Fictibacillus solisalsi]|uniref:Spore coat-associated protein N n=1 Tax=Fictibacillus solisalsi TaxID=459525 RepID=A0A1G9VIS1_9BACL|nr:CalY family protein [Fictibacillus solisalsi]SDM71931.1 spore coat-associated protein N [Fictibacillus solisalsi]